VVWGLHGGGFQPVISGLTLAGTIRNGKSKNKNLVNSRQTYQIF
jgi:hypothetical protein